MNIYFHVLIEYIYKHTHHLVNPYGLFVSPIICSVCSNHDPIIFSFLNYHLVCSKSNTTDVTSSEAGTTYLSGAHGFTAGSMWGSSCLTIRPNVYVNVGYLSK